jgi:hypothetical protein
VTLSVAVPAAPKAYAALSESDGLDGLESERIRVHVAPLFRETSSTTEASGLPPDEAEAATVTCWKAVADAGGDTVAVGGCAGGGAGEAPTGPPAPPFRASVEIVLALVLGRELWVNQNRKAYVPGPRSGSVHVPAAIPSAGVPPAPFRWMTADSFETAPAPYTEANSFPFAAVTNSWPTRFPPPSTRSMRPGALTVPPGLSSHVQTMRKLRT